MTAAAIVLAAACFASSAFAQNSPPSTFDWTSITPSADLNWVPCYEPPTQCTRLTAPLNYSNPEAGSVALALIRHPAASAGQPSYKGPLLFNPGGPGGSGIGLINGLGRTLASVAGPDFDILSWDPRGVGQTTPKVVVFRDAAERAAFGMSRPDAIDLDFKSDNVEDQWARMQVIGRLAQDRDTGIQAHLTTDNVARDMITIATAHGQEKVNYWGISYGSILGTTFATLFPDKVGRLIIDGIVNFDGYYSGDRSTGASDSEKVLDIFLDECHKAGPQLCPFYESSRPALSEKLDKLFADVAKQPVPAYSPNMPYYGTVNLATLKAGIFAALYDPLSSFAFLSMALAELVKGDGTLLYQLAAGNAAPSESSFSVDALVSINCADAEPANYTAQGLRDYAKRSDHLSRFQSVIGGVTLVCSGWRIHPNNFRGPAGGDTSFPLLIIGNTADPATPIANARVTASRFPGSVLLTQDTPGHCSIVVPSECTLAAIHAYLNQGTLPPTGTVCSFSGSYFGPAGSAATVTNKLVRRRNVESRPFVEAAQELRAALGKNPLNLHSLF